jgi:hypothetical protein
MNPLVSARIETRRKLTREGLGPLYDRIHLILLTYNPVGLDLTKGDVRDDDGLPVGTLIQKLRTTNEAGFAHVLYREMQHWHREAAGTPELYDAIADEIWQAWNEFQSPAKLTLGRKSKPRHYRIYGTLRRPCPARD